MNYSKQYISGLIEKFNEGQTTEAEEQILGEYLASAKDIPSEWEVYRDMFESFKTEAYDFTEAETTSYLTTQETLKPSRTIWRWVSAACVAGVAGLLWVLKPATEEEQELTITELCETMSILAETGSGQIDGLSAMPSGKGFVIKASLSNGQACSFSMQRSLEGISVIMQ